MGYSQPVDGSTGLGAWDHPRPVRVIAVSSGKGGVGKTVVSLNLARALTDAGKNVMLLDADLGLGNVDVLTGVRPRFNLGNVLRGECSLEEIVIEDPSGLKLIPATSGVQAMTTLSHAEHAGLIRAFSDLGHDVDVLLIDTAAGISDSVVSFTRAAQEVIMVVCDEPASVTDACALITLLNLEHDVQRFRILANMTRGPKGGREVFQKIARITDRFLDVTLDYLGHVPNDDYVKKAVKRQRTVVEAYPRSKAAQAFRTLAEKTSRWPIPATAAGHVEFFIERLISNSVHDVEVMP